MKLFVVVTSLIVIGCAGTAVPSPNATGTPLINPSSVSPTPTRAAASPTRAATATPGAATPTPVGASPTLRPLPNDVPTPPGPYMFSGDSLYGIASLDITFTVCCEGWISWGPGVVTTENNIRDEVGMGFADVRNLYVDPCHWKSEGEEAPAVGGAVDDLVQAFARQKRFTASAPRDVTLAGFAGRYIELTLDNDLNFDVCDDNAVHSWIDVKGNSRHYQGPGQIEQFWIADVEGTRLVVEGSYFPQASLSDRAELARIIASITVDPR